MKKFIYIIFLLTTLLVSTPIFSQENSKFSLGIGGMYSMLSLGSDWGEFNVGDVDAHIHHDAKPGKDGIGFDTQFFYHPFNWLATGISFNTIYFAQNKQSGWERKSETHQQHYMAAFQLRLTPNSSYKLYVPFGLGMAQTSMKFDFSPKASFLDNSFAYYAGLGVERTIYKHFALSFEARYNGNQFHDKQTLKAGEYNGMDLTGDEIHIDRKLNYISFLLHLNYYF